MGSMLQVKSNTAETEKLLKKLKAKFHQISELEKEYKELVQTKNSLFRSGTPEPGVGSSGLAKLNQSWTLLEHHLNKRKKGLQQHMKQWNRYQNAEDIVSSHLSSAELSVLHDFFSEEAAVDKMKILREALYKLDQQSLQIQLLSVEADCVVSRCDETTGENVKQMLEKIDARWKKVSSDILARVEGYKISMEVEKQQASKQKLIESKVEGVKTKHGNYLSEMKIVIDPRGTLMKLEGIFDSCKSLQQELSSLVEFTKNSSKDSNSEHLIKLTTGTTRLSFEIAWLLSDMKHSIKVCDHDSKLAVNYKDKFGYLDAWLGQIEVSKNNDTSNMKRFQIENLIENVRAQLQAFKTYSVTIDEVNKLGHQLSLNENNLKKLQDLNEKWKNKLLLTTKRFGFLQASLLKQLDFTNMCENWMLFITQAERSLVADVPSSHQGLSDQARSYDLFIIESGARQQLLRSIVKEGHLIMDSGRVEEDRGDFVEKLTKLCTQWKSVIKNARQRKQVVHLALNTWVDYHQQRDSLSKFLKDTKSMMEKYEDKNLMIMKRGIEISLELESSNIFGEDTCKKMLDCGHQVMGRLRGEEHAKLKQEISGVHTTWVDLCKDIKASRRKWQAKVSDVADCEDRITHMCFSLEGVFKILNEPIPSAHEHLHGDMIKCRDNEIMFDMSNTRLRNIEKSVNNLSSCLEENEWMFVDARFSLVKVLWKELYKQTSNRKRMIETRLNDWGDFDENYRELCEWLSEMESKVSQAGELNADDLMDNLQKDYMDEIRDTEDKKVVLVQLGNKLILGGNKHQKAPEIERKMAKINDKWQYLEGLIRARAKKVKETVMAVAQLDTSMTRLRDWLNQIETELSQPIPYQESTDGDITSRLQEQKALEKGVEKHSTGVSSVLNLCEVLLHDNDACGDENDKVSLQDATKSLDRRWRNICALSMDRRLKIEDTQKLWQKFLSDFAQFSEWLNTCEETAKTSNTERLTHEDTKKVLRVQENFQRKVHEGLIQLELINKQYRRLARENRTDASSQIKQMILFGNSRWDTISRRVSETIRRLKHAIDRRENFECLRESLLVWLTESDLQLTNLELFSTSLSKKEKLDKIKVFESKIEEMIPKMKNLDAEGKALVEEGEGEDVATVEEEMNDFHKYCSDMVSRLEKFYHKIIREEGNDAQSSAPNLLDDSEMKNFSWYTARCMSSPSSTSTPSNKLTSLKKVGGRSTPQMVGGLEWDHNYDISQNELEANVLDGLTDDDSIPELSPFETRDEMSKHVKSHGITSPVAVKRSNADDVDALESEQIPGLARKKRRWMTGNNQDQQKQQLKSDVTTLLEWLATMETPTLPKSGDVTIDVIEKKLNQIKYLQKETENRKPIFVSIKLVSSRFAREEKGDSDVTGQVEELSKKWGKLVDEVKSDKEDLLRCFIKSKELKSSLSEVMTLIDTKDGERSDLLSLLKSHNSPVPMSLRELRKIHKSMIQIRLDSLEARSQVASLQEISNELISSEASPRTSSVVGAAETCKRLANLSGRLKTFLNQIKEDIRLAEVSLEQERSRMRSEVSSNSDLESIASEASLYSSPSLKLKILRRKEDSTSSMESFDGRKTRLTNPNLITTTLTSSSNSMTSSNTTSTSSYLKPESDNNSSTNITQNTLVLHNSSTKDIRIADSDGESGYVEFEPEFELLKAALTHVRTTETQKTVTVKGRDASTTTKTNLITEEIDSESRNNYFPILAFLTRCFFAALPFYFLILFILLPIFFPMDCYTETSACLRRNNLYSSVYPSLAWADGPPPT